MSLEPSQRTTGTQRSTSKNPVDKVGGRSPNLVGQTRVGTPKERSSNPTSRSGRPATDASAPNRSYEQIGGASGEIVDVSADRVHTTRES